MNVRRDPGKPVPLPASPFGPEDKNYLTDPVFLIGNGKSRKNFDLEYLRPYGTIIGCNALYRDFSPDILVAIDAKLLNELKDARYEGRCIIPNNRSVKVPPATKWKTERFNTSGCFAMHLISRVMKPKLCFMLGMDNYPGNVYDGTKNYAPNTLQNFTGVGNYYLQALQGPGETVYVNVNDQDSWPHEAHKTGKYKSITYSDFKKVLDILG